MFWSEKMANLEKDNFLREKICMWVIVRSNMDDDSFDAIDSDSGMAKPDVEGDWIWYSICLVAMFFLVISCVYITWMQNS